MPDYPYRSKTRHSCVRPAVDPGYAGQPFIPEMLNKIQELAALKKELGYNYLIEIDGSCNTNTFHDLLGAGAEVLSVGTSGLFNLDPNLAVAWDKMTANIRQAEQAA